MTAPKNRSSATSAATRQALATDIRAVGDNRDKAAFARLYKYFGTRLKAYAMKVGADPVSAEEIAQEAMIALWRKASSFDPAKASASTWLFTIVRNKRIDMLRRENRPELTEDDFIHLMQPERSADETVAADQAGDDLHERLKGLPEDQYVVLQKAYFEDKSHRVIADELGLPLGTVKSRIRLALARLKSGLEADDLSNADLSETQT